MCTLSYPPIFGSLSCRHLERRVWHWRGLCAKDSHVYEDVSMLDLVSLGQCEVTDLLLQLGNEFVFCLLVYCLYPCAWRLNRTIDLALRTSFLGRVHDWCYAVSFPFDLRLSTPGMLSRKGDFADGHQAAHDFGLPETNPGRLQIYTGLTTLVVLTLGQPEWILAGYLLQQAPARTCQLGNECSLRRDSVDLCRSGERCRGPDPVCALAFSNKREPDPVNTWILQEHKWWCKQSQLAGPCNCASFSCAAAAATGPTRLVPSIDLTVAKRCSSISAISACDFAAPAITACDGAQDVSHICP